MINVALHFVHAARAPPPLLHSRIHRLSSRPIASFHRSLVHLSYLTYPVPRHARHAINPDPLHATHARGSRGASPSAASTSRSALVALAALSRRPVPEQNAHGSPPVDAHAAHGDGSPLAPRTRAVSPSANTEPATETSCVVSYGFAAASTVQRRRGRAREDVLGRVGRARREVGGARARMTDAMCGAMTMPMPTRRQWDAMVVSATTTTTSTRVMTGTGRWSVTSARARATRPRRHARLARDDVTGRNPSIRARGRRSTRCRAERGNGDDGVETKGEESLSVVDRAPSRASIDAVRERARVSPSSARAEAPALLDDYRERWDVPWGGETVALGLFGWCVSFVGVAAVVFPLAMAKAGIDPAKMTTGEQAEYLLAVQLAETATSLGLVYALVSRHMDVVRDEEKDWFKIDFSEPFERERGWAKYGLLGYGATFFALAATGLVVDALESGAQTVDKASEVGTIDGVMPLIQSDESGTFVAVLAVTSVLAPLLEEVVFRGFLLASLTKWLPTPGAVLFSSVLFALAHLAPRDFVELVVLGLVLGFSYARTRNLLTPMLIHSLWNSGVLVVVAVAIKAGVASELGIPGF